MSLRDRLGKVILINWSNRLKRRKQNSWKTNAKYRGVEGKSDVPAPSWDTAGGTGNANWKGGEAGLGFVGLCTQSSSRSCRVWDEGCSPGSLHSGAAPALLLQSLLFSSRAGSPSPQLDLAWNILFSRFDFNPSVRSFGMDPTPVCE